MLPPFPARGLRGWQALASCRNPPDVVGREACKPRAAPPTCARALRYPATRRGAGLAGGQPARRPPAPAGAGPRERGRLGLRMSLPPLSYVRQLCSRRLQASGPCGHWHRSCNLLVAK